MENWRFNVTAQNKLFMFLRYVGVPSGKSTKKKFRPCALTPQKDAYFFNFMRILENVAKTLSNDTLRRECWISHYELDAKILYVIS